MIRIGARLAVVALGIALAQTFSQALTLFPESAIAVVTKVILDVTRKESGREWIVANRGETLASGDRVRTGAGKSLAVIKFKDNSFVKVRENSELTITGELKGSDFRKDVSLLKGVIGFSVQKQRKDEEFRFTSPTSVASIRGTGGLFIARTSNDTLIVTDGNVHLTNVISGQSVDVPAGFTGLSFADGTIQVRPSNPGEKAIGEEGARASDQGNRLEFDLRDNQGNQKKLKIEYKE